MRWITNRHIFTGTRKIKHARRAFRRSRARATRNARSYYAARAWNQYFRAQIPRELLGGD